MILVLNLALILFTCQYYSLSLQLPWWGVLLACAIAFFFTLPIGIIAATTNQVKRKLFFSLHLYVTSIGSEIDSSGFFSWHL